jgi:hypothetical protein
VPAIPCRLYVMNNLPRTSSCPVQTPVAEQTLPLDHPSTSRILPSMIVLIRWRSLAQCNLGKPRESYCHSLSVSVIDHDDVASSSNRIRHCTQRARPRTSIDAYQHSGSRHTQQWSRPAGRASPRPFLCHISRERPRSAPLNIH